MLIVQMVYLKKDVKYLYSNQSYFKIIIALAISTVVVLAVKHFISGVLVKLVISAVLFLSIEFYKYLRVNVTHMDGEFSNLLVLDSRSISGVASDSERAGRFLCCCD